MTPRVRRVALTAAPLVVFSCIAAKRTLDLGAPDSRVPATGSAGAAAVTPAPKPAAAPSLREFTPLLARPELAGAARALDDGDATRAADLVQTMLTKESLEPAQRLRFALLLGRLDERAGKLEEAANAYRAALAEPWALSGYAELGEGRVLAALGRDALALDHLRQVGDSTVAQRAARPIVAASAYKLGERELALSTWRAELDDGPDAVETSTTALLLGAALLDGGSSGPGAPDAAREALGLARRALRSAPEDAQLTARARVLERRALDALPADQRAAAAVVSPAEQLETVHAFVEAHKYDDALALADMALAVLDARERWHAVGCELVLERAKSLAGQRLWGKAADALVDPAKLCTADADLRARILFVAGKYSAADGRDALAVHYYEDLEHDYPTSTLADDARFRAALSYLELGVEARFTELLSRMPDDYPAGDMTLDGIFRLALRRVERGDWEGATVVLDRVAALVSGRDSARGTEFSGRERYFRARAWLKTGQRARGLDELAAIVRELPLSYYMLHAYTRLKAEAPDRALQARQDALADARARPFDFAPRPEYELSGFARALELLRIGDTDFAAREIEAAGLLKADAAPGVLWGVALLYDRAGAAKLSHSVARSLLTDWLERWPEGPWLDAWKLAFPRPFSKIVEAETRSSGTPEPLAYAIMREESAFDPDAESPAMAHGLMQIIVPTARLVAAPLGLPYDAGALKRPSVNVRIGCTLLARLGRRFEDNPLMAIPAYNAGPGRPEKWLKERPAGDFDVWVESIPITETRRYMKRVLASRAAYGWLYGSHETDEALLLPLEVGSAKASTR